MKIAEKIQQNLNEMAKIGEFSNFKLYVYHEPLMQKSFHLLWGQNELAINFPELTVLEVKKLERKYNLKKGDELPNSIKKPLEKFLKSKPSKVPLKDNKEAIEVAWILLNE